MSVVRICPVLLLLLASLLPTATHGQAFDQPVDVELLLAVDVSGSMDPEEHALQRQGYVAAIRSEEFRRTVRNGAYGRIAIAYVEWAGIGRQAVVLPWVELASDTDIDSVAGHLAQAPIAFIRGTSLSSILDFAGNYFDGNGFEGLRQVIDVSGDGPNNMGGPVVDARDRVLKRGITINGLPIMVRPSLHGSSTTPSLDEYFTACVIGGPGAFVLPVREIETMAEAIRRKLVLEIAGAPVPAARLFAAQARPPVDCRIGERLRRFWMEP